MEIIHMKRNANTRVKSATPEDLPLPVVEGLLAGNLLPAAMASKPLPFTVPKWPGEDPTEDVAHALQCLWNDTSVMNVSYEGPIDEAKLTFTVPTHELTEGTHLLSYNVTIGEDPRQLSEKLTVIIDLTAPTLPDPSAMELPEDMTDGVTPEYLLLNQDKVQVKVPYADGEVDDVIIYFLDVNDDDDEEVGRRTLGAADIGNDIFVDYSGEAFRASGDGARKLRYQISDRAGNVTLPADYVTVAVRLDEEPVDIVAPPRFRPEDVVNTDGGLITLEPDVIHAGDGVDVLIDLWQNLPPPGATDTIMLLWGDGHDGSTSPEMVDSLDLMGPINPGDAPFVLRVPDKYLHPDGNYQLLYRLIIWTGEYSDSRRIPVVVDTTAPWGAEVPPKPIVADGAEVNDEYLEQHPEGLVWRLPAYADLQPGDQVMWWWLNALPSEDLPPPNGVADVSEFPLDLHVPKEVIERVGDGGCYLAYVLRDKATNLSQLSRPTKVAVALGDLPGALPPPEVPQAEKGWIDLHDVHDGGIYVSIADIPNWKATDRIWLSWANFTMQPEQIGNRPFPLLIRVPDVAIRDQYEAAGTPGAVTTTISYRILRGDVVFGPATNTVDVDLSVAGPDLPEWPDTINPALGQPEVMGKTSQQLNILTRDDNGQDATLTFTMYTPALAGEEVRVYWGTELAVTYEVTGTETAGEPVTVEIPWDVIQQVNNNPALPVHFRVGHPDSPNEQRSGTTLVDADAVVLVPPPVEVPAAEDSPLGPMVACRHLDGPLHAILIKVPDLSAFLDVGDTVTLTWTPHRGNPEEEELTDAIFEQPVTLNEEQLAGFIWRVEPYEDYILPTYDGPLYPVGYAYIKYTLQHGGHELTSEKFRLVVAMYHGNGSCELSLGATL